MVRKILAYTVQKLSDLSPDALDKAVQELLAALEEHLQPEADAEVGLASPEVLAYSLLERPAALAQARHAVAKGALPGHNESVGGSQAIGIARDDRLSPGARECPLHAAEVSRPGIDDGDHG